MTEENSSVWHKNTLALIYRQEFYREEFGAMRKENLIVKRGTCILTEKPFVHILKEKYRKDRCSTCFKLGKVLKCSNCQYVYYCNRACQLDDWSLHKNECNYLKKVGLRTIPDAARILARIIVKLQSGGDLIRSFYTENSSRKFMDMMSHYLELKNDPKRMEHLESLQVVLSSLLDEKLLPNPAELLGIYGRLITNGFNILDAEMNSIGTGIYLAVSVTDHSCIPNAVAVFEGTTLFIRVTEDLPCLDWSKVFISYIDLLNTAEDRRRDLKENYYFLCVCKKCIDKREYIEMSAAACPNNNCREFVEIEGNSCTGCGNNISEDHKTRYKEVTEFTKTQLETMKEIAYLDVCKICLQKQDKILHPLNLWHIKTLDSGFEGAINIGAWSDALEFGKKLVPGFRKYYGDWNPLLGLLYIKLAKIQLYQNLENEARANLENAKRIIEVTHGTNHSLYKEQLLPLIFECRP